MTLLMQTGPLTYKCSNYDSKIKNWSLAWLYMGPKLTKLTMHHIFTFYRSKPYINYVFIQAIYDSMLYNLP
ncbi:hypothetical protein HanRHA438_Chr10g0436461 [Helianthus annuus]|nr:hypothetical protein HanRHA438_Chr10g0436461 [Helianthus annuus]